MDACDADESYVRLGSCALDYAMSGITSLDEAVRIAGGVDIDTAAVRPSSADEAAA